MNKTPYPWPVILFFALLGQTLIIQNQVSWTLTAGLVCYLLAGYALVQSLPQPSPKPPSSAQNPYTELFLLFLILIIGFVLRVYRLDQFPSGIFPDEGQLALNAERMARENLFPFQEIFQWWVCVPSIYYSLYAWFHLIPASQISFFLYSAFVSLLALPFLYFVYRSLSNAPTALTAVFFLAVSRWFLTYSRDGHPAVEVPFYIGLTLTFWLYAVSKGKTWAFGLCGATLALSFYSYQDLYFLPILVFGYALYEACMSNDKPRFLRNTAVLFLCFLILSMPILEQIFRHSGLNLRDKELLAFPNLFLEQGFTGVWNHFLETLMVFNRRGDSWPYHNIPDHRQLDDVTGVLWLLGLFYSISRLKERKHFYPLLGFGLFLLPAFLSVDSRHASRLIGTLPFVFFLAAQVLIDFHQEIKGLKPKILPAIILSLLLFLSVAQNAWDYFQVQAKNTDCWRVCGGAEDSWVAQAIQRYSGSYTCLVCQKFYKNFQINFLDYDLAPQIGCWKLPQSLYLKGLNPRKGVCLFFQEGQWGDLKLFQDLYPGGATEWFKDLDGNPIAGFYLIPPPLWVNRSVLLGRHSLTHGLKGVYYLSAQEKGLPALIQVDPVLNFTFRNDFSIADFPPLAVHWTGSLIIPKNGIYEWTVLTTDDFQMSVDGIKVLWHGQTDHGLYLKKGNHRLEAHFLKTDGVDTILNLMWKTPGSSRFEILPAQSVKPFP